MKDFHAPVYVLDYRDTQSCARLATLIRDKSGKEKTMEVHVRPEHDPTAKPILAKAISNPVSKMLTVGVTTEDGQQTFDADYDDVLYGMSQAHPDRKW
jgi:hypothetical protein